MSHDLARLLLFIDLFSENLATGASLTGAILSCHVELSKSITTQENYSKHKEKKTIVAITISIFCRISGICQQH